MRIEDEYKRSGYFWLPENPDKKIPGTLTIFDGGKIEIEIVGLFNNSIRSSNREYELGRIVGDVEKDGFVTLDDCFYAERNRVSRGIAKSRVSVGILLTGAAYDKDEQLTFNTLSFSVDDMDEWVGISGIEVLTDHENLTATISYVPPSSLFYSLTNGMRLEVCFQHALPDSLSSITEAKITQKAYFKLSSEESKSLTEFMANVYKIVNLLCFAMDTTVNLKELTGTSNEIRKNSGSSNSYPVPIHIYYKNVPFSKKEPSVSYHQMLFTFEVIKENAEDVFNNWIGAYDTLAPALGLYFSTQTGAQRYLDGKFLALAQGLETYHRRTSSEKLMDDSEFEKLVESIMKYCPEEKTEWLKGRLRHGNEISLANRITKIIQPFKGYIGNSCKRSKIVRSIVDTRNYLTHYDESLKSRAAEGKELWILCSKMEAIFQLHFLKVVGFTEEEVSSVVQNCYSLRKKLNEI